MQAEEFLQFLLHFANHTKPSLDSKVLLLLDNHVSHLSVPAMDFCRERGIVLLTFPPHCTHKLCPLDRTVFRSFKGRVNTHLDHWMKAHPGQNATIYDLPGIVAKALPQAATPENIMSGFRCTGIWPYSPDVFGENDFAPAYATDRPEPTTSSAGSATLHQDSSALHQGSSALHQGSSALHQGSSALHQGSSALHQGSSALHQGSSALHQGSSALHQDSSALHQGSSALHQDSSALHQGSSALHQDSSALHQGSSALHQGSCLYIPTETE
ncbi:uncharacterized protein LOC107757054 isoform X2 [Sinocyclocheilus rhinocerous]|uniref:uncharacterized protein LOC107757054 isoform X2 n=1 Tax=Sinocyclocheilus rhinocerous TaxID=307959 RepID=UPI0007BA5313|nr:PREDICTED: uncharacterized protein LOC107757054 isoform X2 [Sinocyclocheilus rhinocerous]